MTWNSFARHMATFGHMEGLSDGGDLHDNSDHTLKITYDNKSPTIVHYLR